MTEHAEHLVAGLRATDDEQPAHPRPITLLNHAMEPSTVWAAEADVAVALTVHPEHDAVFAYRHLITDRIDADAGDPLRKEPQEALGVDRPQRAHEGHRAVSRRQHPAQERGLVGGVDEANALEDEDERAPGLGRTLELQRASSPSHLPLDSRAELLAQVPVFDLPRLGAAKCVTGLGQ